MPLSKDLTSAVEQPISVRRKGLPIVGADVVEARRCHDRAPGFRVWVVGCQNSWVFRIK